MPLPADYVYHQLLCWAANGTLSLVEGPVALAGAENTVEERSFTLATSGNNTLTLRQHDFDFACGPAFYDGYTVELRLNDLPVAS